MPIFLLTHLMSLFHYRNITIFKDFLLTTLRSIGESTISSTETVQTQENDDEKPSINDRLNYEAILEHELTEYIKNKSMMQRKILIQNSLFPVICI